MAAVMDAPFQQLPDTLTDHLLWVNMLPECGSLGYTAAFYGGLIIEVHRSQLQAQQRMFGLINLAYQHGHGLL
jgi:hypothetical protein